VLSAPTFLIENFSQFCQYRSHPKNNRTQWASHEPRCASFLLSGGSFLDAPPLSFPHPLKISCRTFQIPGRERFFPPSVFFFLSPSPSPMEGAFYFSVAADPRFNLDPPPNRWFRILSFDVRLSGSFFTYEFFVRSHCSAYLVPPFQPLRLSSIQIRNLFDFYPYLKTELPFEAIPPSLSQGGSRSPPQFSPLSDFRGQWQRPASLRRKQHGEVCSFWILPPLLVSCREFF